MDITLSRSLKGSLQGLSIINYSQISGLEFCCFKTGELRWDLYIVGPRGCVHASDMGWYPVVYFQEFPDRLWDLYQLLLTVIGGVYHCCLSGKCSLYLDNAR